MADERATIYDVAKRAGVSVATVSRYINHSGVVSEKAQLRITDAVQELRYIPNTFAKSLKTSCSNLIMMIVPDISNEYYAEMYKVIQRAVGEHGYSILLINTNGQPAEEQRALQLAQQQHCDALAFFPVRHQRHAPAGTGAGHPLFIQQFRAYQPGVRAQHPPHRQPPDRAGPP